MYPWIMMGIEPLSVGLISTEKNHFPWKTGFCGVGSAEDTDPPHEQVICGNEK